MNEDPLDSELWLIELSGMVEECDANDRVDAYRLLSRLYTLFAIAPRGWNNFFEPLPDNREFGALLDSGAFESAAIRLLGSKAGYILSRSADGVVLASVWLPPSCREVHAKADSESVALLKAYSMAILFSLREMANLGGNPSLESF